MSEDNLDQVDKILDEIRRNSSAKKNEEDFDNDKSDIKENKAPDEQNESQEETMERLSYSLTEPEAYLCLKKAGLYKTSGKRAVVYTVLMALAAAGFLISYIIQKNINWLVFAIISLCVIAVIWIVPTFHLKRLSKLNSNGKVINAAIYKDKIEINSNENSWKINLDRTNSFARYDDILMFRITENNQFFVIPVRVISGDKLEKILNVIEQGTIPFT